MKPLYRKEKYIETVIAKQGRKNTKSFVEYRETTFVFNIPVKHLYKLEELPPSQNKIGF